MSLKKIAKIGMACGLALASLPLAARADTTWDGGGVADANWTTNTNWGSDTLPAFNGTDNITIDALNASGLATQLNGDKNINSLTSTPNLTYSINGNTLTLQSGNLTGSSTSQNLTVNSNLSLGANGTFNIGGGGGGAVTINGVISDDPDGNSVSNGYSLTKSGGRSITLNGVNTYTGTTSLNSGLTMINSSVGVNTPGPFGNAGSAINIGSASFYSLNVGGTIARDITVTAGGAFFGGVAGTGTTTFSGGVTLNGNATFYSNNGNPGMTQFTGVISGAGNLLLNRRVRLAGLNTYTGTTTISDANGVPLMANNSPSGAPGAFGNATTAIQINSAGITIDGPYTLGRNINMAGSASLSMGQAGTGTFAGDIVMSSGVVLTAANLSGAGTTVFSGAISGPGSFLLNGGGGPAGLPQQRQ